MKKQLETIVKLYRQLACSIPSPKGGYLKRQKDGTPQLQTFWQVVDLEKLEYTTFVKDYIASSRTGQLEFIEVGFPTDIGTECLSCMSPSGHKRAVLRKIIDSKGLKKQILEVWTKHGKVQSIDLKALDVHGDVCDDGTFGCLEWSSDETQLLYVAEPKTPKEESFFAAKSEQSTNEKGIGHLREEWGEQLVGRHHPSPCILNLESLEITLVQVESHSCGQAIWGPGNKSIIFVAWDEKPRRLGLIFCPIRKNKLCSYQLKNLTLDYLYDVEGWCIRNPRLSPDEHTLVFLDNPVGGPHRGCSRICKFQFEDSQHEVIVEMVKIPEGDEFGFPGLYADTIPKKCWVDSEVIVLESFWRSRQELLAINIANGSIQKLTNDELFGAWSLADICDGLILAYRSSLNIKGHFVLGEIKQVFQGLEANWTPIEPMEEYYLNDIDMFTLTDQLPEANGMPFEALVSKPKDVEGKIPVIFVPHGGPHSVMTPQFYLSVFMYNQMGFAVVLVNFRGSLGFGQDSLESLLTGAGVQDVKEMVLMTNRILELGWADPQRLALSGGSYGGYLTTQLAGQYSDLYRACICRNPVTDINTTVDTSDIPDWSWVTAGLGDGYSSTALPDPKIRENFWSKSPIRYVENVKADFLMLLSKNDLRVPPSQGLNYFYQLKALGNAKTKLFVYDDNHSQRKADVECDAFVRSALWLMEAFYPE